MTFSDEVIRKVWKRSGGRCECRRKSHKHPYGRCGILLDPEKRRKKEPVSWEVLKIDDNGPYTLENCEILCGKCFMENIKTDDTLL
jgi:hypothetical protein